MTAWLGPAIAAGGSLLGGLLGSDSGYDERKFARREAKKQRNFILGQERRNYADQKEFAQNTIQWRAQDAKAAGIHPLAALGSQGALYSPVGGTPSTPVGDFGGNDPMGDAVANAAAQLSEMFAKPSPLEEAQTDYWKAKAEESKATTRTQISNLRSGRASPFSGTNEVEASRGVFVDKTDPNHYSLDENIGRWLEQGVVPYHVARWAYKNSHLPDMKQWIERGANSWVELLKIAGKHMKSGEIDYKGPAGNSP